MQKPNIYIFPQLVDNYGYLIKNPHAKEAAIVDPSDLEICERILIGLDQILNSAAASYSTVLGARSRPSLGDERRACS